MAQAASCHLHDLGGKVDMVQVAMGLPPVWPTGSYCISESRLDWTPKSNVLALFFLVNPSGTCTGEALSWENPPHTQTHTCARASTHTHTPQHTPPQLILQESKLTIVSRMEKELH